MQTPSVSIRKFIRRLPDEASEPTSTLVLTSHTSHFVDIRIYAALQEDGTREPLPQNGVPMSRLDWAFAGVSTTTACPQADGPSHTVWSHWIDSESSDPDVDEGDMYEQEDGDILERGQNVDAKTGEVKKYEELWHDVGVQHVGNDQTDVSVVLKLDETNRNTRAMVVRVGDWCQGILKVGDAVTVERWQWTPAATGHTVRGSNGSWERIARLGNGSLPCPVTFETERLEEGKRISVEALEWEVVELYRWK